MSASGYSPPRSCVGSMRPTGFSDRAIAFQAQSFRLFDRVSELKAVEEDLGRAMVNVNALLLPEENRTQQDEKRKILRAAQAVGERRAWPRRERNFKPSLAQETQNKQSEYERVFTNSSSNRQGTAEDIASLEEKLKDKLDSIDQSLARCGDILLNWPVDPSGVLRRPSMTGPIRSVICSSIRERTSASVGTDIRSSRRRLCGLNKTGRMYGTIRMVVHPGNIATVYAYLTKFLAKPGFVCRSWEVIKRGGRPGIREQVFRRARTRISEVRQNGIPVDPQNFCRMDWMRFECCWVPSNSKMRRIPLGPCSGGLRGIFRVCRKAAQDLLMAVFLSRHPFRFLCRFFEWFQDLAGIPEAGDADEPGADVVPRSRVDHPQFLPLEVVGDACSLDESGWSPQ